MQSFICWISVCKSGRVLLVGCDDNTGRVIDLQTKKSRILAGHTDVVRCMIECIGTDVLSCSFDKTIRRWNLFTGECIRTFIGHSAGVSSILFHQETNRILSSSADKSIRIWNAETGQQIGEVNEQSSSVLSLAWVNPTTFVSGSDDHTVKIWNADTLQEIRTMSSHTSVVNSVAATLDGGFHAISGSGDRTVKVWSLATGECIASISHHSSHVFRVAVSPDGRYIASGGRELALFLLRAVPPFPFVIHQGPLLDSNTASFRNHFLLSDGRLLCSSNVVYNLSKASNIRVTLDSETRLKIRNIESITGENIDNGERILSAHSAVEARQWIEALYALQENLSVSPEKQYHSSQAVIHRHRYNIFQQINLTNKVRVIPRDVTRVVGFYVMVEASRVSF